MQSVRADRGRLNAFETVDAVLVVDLVLEVLEPAGDDVAIERRQRVVEPGRDVEVLTVRTQHPAERSPQAADAVAALEFRLDVEEEGLVGRDRRDSAAVEDLVAGLARIRRRQQVEEEGLRTLFGVVREDLDEHLGAGLADLGTDDRRIDRRRAGRRRVVAPGRRRAVGRRVVDLEQRLDDVRHLEVGGDQQAREDRRAAVALENPPVGDPHRLAAVVGFDHDGRDRLAVAQRNATRGVAGRGFAERMRDSRASG